MGNEKLPERLGPEGLVVLEVETEREAPAAPSWELLDRRKYGSSAILFYALKEGA
jgi:16S rRNA G966 N2-methylase RsmD